MKKSERKRIIRDDDRRKKRKVLIILLLVFLAIGAAALLIPKGISDKMQGEHVHIFTDWIAPKDPTCTEPGWVGHYHCATCGEDFDRDKVQLETSAVPALGHDHEVLSWSWDGYEASALCRCRRDGVEETLDAEMTSAVTTAPTCTESGVRTYTASLLGESVTKTEPIAAIGHDYQFTSIAFAEDGKTATALYTCSHDGKHTVTYSATVTSAQKAAPTCEANGTTTYTASYGGHSATKDVADITKIGHDYKFTSLTFAEDGKTATALYTCSHDSKHTVSYTATVTSAVKTAATCEEMGTTTYTAKYTPAAMTSPDQIESGEQTATKDVTDIAKLGHDYKFTSITFAADGKTATALYTCSHDSKHTVSDSAAVTSAVKTAATCEAMGTTTYTAKVTPTAMTSPDKIESGEKTATKDVTDIAKLGHDYKFTSLTFAENGKTATALYTCSHDSKHTKSFNATVTSAVKTAATCEAMGTTTYTAKYTPTAMTSPDKIEAGEKTATKDVTDIAKLGHDYKFTSITFAADGKTATALYTCSRDSGHTKSFNATVTSAVKTAATCEAMGTTTYTAKVTPTAMTSPDKIEAGEKTATKDVTDIAKLGHDYKFTSLTFAEDGKTATALYTCSHDSKHTKSFNATVTSAVKTAATCEAMGTTTYTAKYTPTAMTSPDKIESGEKSATKDVTDIAKLGHDYKFTSITFSEDGKTATALYTCSHDSKHTKSFDATVTSAVKTAATCEAMGTTTYTAKVTPTAMTSPDKIEAGEKTATKDVTDIAKLGHDYKFTSLTFAENGKTATALYTCSHDSKHTKSFNATVTSAVKTAATCEAMGTTTYTAKYTPTAMTSPDKIEAGEKTATKDVTDIAKLGHDYKFTSLTFAENGKTATALYTCSHDSKHTVSYSATVTSAQKTAATCEAMGTTTYTAKYTPTAMTSPDKIETAEQTATKDVTDIAKLGHDYKFTSITFSEDGKTATALYTCSHDSTHTKSFDATVTSAVKTAATCEAMGTTTYTAKFTPTAMTSPDKIEAGEKTATKDVTDIAKLGHDYKFTSITFSEDGKTATALYTCSHDGKHTKSFNATVTSAVKTAATCEAMGTTTYTAKYTPTAMTSPDKIESGEKTATKDVTDIARLGHDYKFTSITFSEDGKTATALYTCSHDGKHTKSFNATVTSSVKTAATCEAMGTTTYTAKFTPTAMTSPDKIEAGEKTATKDVTDIAKLGHDYKFTSLTFAENGKTATALYTCSHDSKHTKSFDATVTSAVKTAATCEAMGTTTYTAKYTPTAMTSPDKIESGEKTATKDVTDIAKLGHDYKFTSITFAADGKTATALYTCSHDSKHTKSFDATVTSAVKTAATCEAMGTTTYTAKVTPTAMTSPDKIEAGEKTATKDVTDIAKLGHNYVPEVTTQPTCTEPGVRTYTCSHDATHTYTEPIAALGHNFVDGICSRCGEIEGLIFTLNEAGNGYVVTEYDGSRTTLQVPATYGEIPVTEIGPRAFIYHDTMTSIVLPDSVTVIGKDAFGGCNSLTTFTIPEKVVFIGESAFAGCSKLAGITVPAGVTALAPHVFEGCRRLTSVSILGDVISIGDSAFRDCSQLSSIDIPGTVTSIGSYAFSGCRALTSLVLPNGVTTVGKYAFSGCSALTSVTIPASVTEIGEYAFSDCAALTDVYFGGSSEDWANLPIASGNEVLTAATVHYAS